MRVAAAYVTLHSACITNIDVYTTKDGIYTPICKINEFLCAYFTYYIYGLQLARPALDADLHDQLRVTSLPHAYLRPTSGHEVSLM
jgi:hypothetical protein